MSAPTWTEAGGVALGLAFVVAPLWWAMRAHGRGGRVNRPDETEE